MDGLAFGLEPCGVITGTVQDEDRDPVQGVIVQAINVHRNSGFQGGAQEPTNDLGEYRLYNLTPGRYLVQVSSPRRPERSANPQQAYVSLFYPGVASLEEAMPVSVQPGNEAQGVGFDLKPVHAVRVRGRIINQVTGRPPDNGYVTLLPRDTDSRTRKGLIQLMPAAQTGAGVRDEQGDFEIEGVPSGSYWLYGGSQEKDRRYQGRAPVEVGNTDVQGVELTVSAGTTLTGRVRNEPSRAFDLSKLAIAISTADGMGSAATQARRDGTFVLESVANGSCRLNVSGFPEQYYVKSASLGGTDVLESGLTIDSGGAAAPDIVLIPSGRRELSTTFLP